MKLLQWLDKHFEEVLTSIFLCGIVIMMSTHVFCRYVLRAPLTWTEECTRYMFIWFVFMGVSYGIRNDTHIRVNILELYVPKLQPILTWFRNIVEAAFVIYLIPAGYYVIAQVTKRNQTSAGLHLPMQFVYGALELGLIFSLIRVIQKFYLGIRDLMGGKKGGADK